MEAADKFPKKVVPQSSPGNPAQPNSLIMPDILSAQMQERSDQAAASYSNLFWNFPTPAAPGSSAEDQAQRLEKAYGKATALFLTGQVLFEGDPDHNIDRDVAKGIAYLLEAFNLDHPSAEVSLINRCSWLVENSNSFPPEVRNALEQLASRKNQTAHTLLGKLDLKLLYLEHARIPHQECGENPIECAEKICQQAAERLSENKLEAIKLYRNAAALGSSKAAFMLSQLVVDNTDKDSDIDGDQIEANVALKKFLATTNRKADLETAIAVIQNKPEKELVDTYLSEATTYLNADPKPKVIFSDNLPRVIKILTQAAGNNNPTAYYLLGVLHFMGWCDGAHWLTAVDHFKQALELGYKRGVPPLIAKGIKKRADALLPNYLIQLQMSGLDVRILYRVAATDPITCKELFSDAASLWDSSPAGGHENAMLLFRIVATSSDIAAWSLHDKGMAPFINPPINKADAQKALKLLRIMAESGFHEVMYKLYELLSDSTNPIHDPDEAERWLQRSADKGNIKAQDKLLEKPEKMTSAQKDQAKQRCINAIDSGSLPAMLLLAGIYESYIPSIGPDIRNNQIKADRWRNKAADAGDPTAIKIRNQRQLSEEKLIKEYFSEVKTYLDTEPKPATIFTDTLPRVMKMLTQAAGNKNPTACYLLGVLHCMKWCDEANWKIAASNFEQALKLGYKDEVHSLVANTIVNQHWIDHNADSAIPDLETALYKVAVKDENVFSAMLTKASKCLLNPKDYLPPGIRHLLMILSESGNEKQLKQIYQKALILHQASPYNQNANQVFFTLGRLGNKEMKLKVGVLFLSSPLPHNREEGFGFLIEAVGKTQATQMKEQIKQNKNLRFDPPNDIHSLFGK